MMAEKFWMVKGADATKIKYPVKHLAVAEAKRLAAASNNDFYVLEAVECYTRGEVPVVEVPLINPVDQDFN